ncbi:MAG: 5'-nucleotidase C-terminal domain-containing protein [Bacteriovoracaceae bacterium]|nr:5'-nucleotidase C-terminal domain-containing protein [Bacteriovoracaceae bacterium]
MSKIKFLLILVLSALSLASIAGVDLTILHTNDHHGHYWVGRHGNHGMAARHTLVERVRKEVKEKGGYLLILDAGDVNTGTAESDIFNARPDFMAMNLIGYDAMAIGNHEFDNSPAVLINQQSWAKFPMLSANIYDMKNGKRKFTPYIIKKIGEYRVAIVGLIAEDTPSKVSTRNIIGLKFTNAVAEMKKLMPELKKKSDFIVVISHMGFYKNALHKTNAPGDVTLAKAVPGIMAIVGGHTHEKLGSAPIIAKTVIGQAGQWGKNVGRIDLKLGAKGQYSVLETKLIKINLKKKIKVNGKKKRVLIGAEIPQSKAMVKLLTPYYEKAQVKISKKVGSLDKELDGSRSSVRKRQMPIGKMIAEAMVLVSGADIAFMNGGGIRAGLPAGNITIKDLIEVHPFGNTVCTIKVSGKELKEYLLKAAVLSKNDGAYPQLSTAAVIVENGTFKKFTINGKKVIDSKTYTVAVTSFSAGGGDGYPAVLNHHTFVDSGFSLGYAIRKFVDKRKGKLKVKFLKRKGKVIFN